MNHEYFIISYGVKDFIDQYSLHTILSIMDTLTRIIGQMSKEEIRYFKIYATRMTGYEGRKDLLLFDTIRKKKEEYDERATMQKIAGGNNNSFYRLKNRLASDINDFIALHYFDADKSHGLNRDWALYYVYLSKRQFELAYTFLKKAEKKAVELENFEMLDLIYGHLIRISNEMLLVNPEDYIALQKENASRVNLLREMDQALAALSYRLRITQNWAKENTTLTKLLEKTLKEFTSDARLAKSLVFQTRLYQAVSQVLLQRHQYKELAEFVSQTYKSFEQKKWFNKENHQLKLQMLTYMANALFRTDKFQQSLEYTEILGQELDAFNQFLRDKFVFFYYNSLALNYMKTDLPAALKAIEQMESEMKRSKISYYNQFIYLNKAIALYWLGKPEAGIRSLVKLSLLDSFKETDSAFRLRISVAELIMQFDSGDIQTFNTRLKQLRTSFKELLSTSDFASENELLAIMEEMLAEPSYATDKKITLRIKKFTKIIGKKQEEAAGIINYGDWLNLKLHK